MPQWPRLLTVDVRSILSSYSRPKMHQPPRNEIHHHPHEILLLHGGWSGLRRNEKKPFPLTWLDSVCAAGMTCIQNVRVDILYFFPSISGLIAATAWQSRRSSKWKNTKALGNVKCCKSLPPCPSMQASCCCAESKDFWISIPEAPLQSEPASIRKLSALRRWCKADKRLQCRGSLGSVRGPRGKWSSKLRCRCCQTGSLKFCDFPLIQWKSGYRERITLAA